MNRSELESVAGALVADGKGILAADESTGTISRRLASVDVDSTENTRRNYREMLFTAPDIEHYLSGVILYDETIRQTSRDGRLFREILVDRGIMPGIKVDTGAKDLALFPGEKITEGLDGLRDRIAEYVDMGARFAKWRAVITIGEGIPTRHCIQANGRALARYAALCQEGGLVPIVEPEVLMDGDHTIARCEEATTDTLRALFAELLDQRVHLEGLLLKPNMVLSGKECPEQADAQTVAEVTVDTLRRVVPAAVPGIVFLSGGQSPARATQHLDAMNRLLDQPWQLSFSFARALQGPALETWRGRSENIPEAQRLFAKRVRLASVARRGQYTRDMERQAA